MAGRRGPPRSQDKLAFYSYRSVARSGPLLHSLLPPTILPLMTRFKEWRRIEQAIKHRDQRELAWAQEYCEGRVAVATRSALWRRILKRVLAAKSQT